MKITDVITTCTAIWTANPQQAIYISGPPGCGKTSVTTPIAHELGIKPENVHIFRPSLHDPVDILGVPSVSDGQTKWNTPTWLHKLQEGRHLLCIDELPQSVKMMQNALAGLMLDRFVGDVHLSDEVYIIATGNRTQDRAGANRMLTQLANRVLEIEMDVNTDDWVAWALEQQIDPLLIAFHRWKSGLLSDFDPDRSQNPTPRSWGMVARVPTDLPPDLYMDAVTGLVGSGAAAEYCGFRRLADKLPSIDHIILDPANAPVPEEPDVRYVCVATLSTRVTFDNYSGMIEYVERMPVEYQVLFNKTAISTKPNEHLTNHKDFTRWVSKNAKAFQ